MISILILFLIILLVILICHYKTSGRIKNIFKILALLYVIIPFVFILIPLIFKTQFQQGKIFPELGKALMYISPPEDFSVPLIHEDVTLKKNEYIFDLKHKYVGNHVIEIIFSKHPDLENYLFDIRKELSIRLIVLKNGKQIYIKDSSSISKSGSKDTCSFGFIYYEVPYDLPINTVLTAKILFSGNLDKMLKKYGKATISIRKHSDE